MSACDNSVPGALPPDLLKDIANLFQFPDCVTKSSTNATLFSGNSSNYSSGCQTINKMINVVNNTRAYVSCMLTTNKQTSQTNINVDMTINFTNGTTGVIDCSSGLNVSNNAKIISNVSINNILDSSQKLKIQEKLQDMMKQILTTATEVSPKGENLSTSPSAQQNLQVAITESKDIVQSKDINENLMNVSQVLNGKQTLNFINNGRISGSLCNVTNTFGAELIATQIITNTINDVVKNNNVKSYLENLGINNSSNQPTPQPSNKNNSDKENILDNKYFWISIVVSLVILIIILTIYHRVSIDRLYDQFSDCN